MTEVVRTIAELRRRLDGVEQPVSLVPTMGAFHDGHRALMRAARMECETVVVSLFVNPAQFGSGEDLGRYPRDLDRDVVIATDEGADILFVPDREEIYPPGFATWVNVEGFDGVLEGASRPGHFRGVATVCLKLFLVTRPDRVYFGQKDAQQVSLVRRLIADMALPITLRVAPTVRDHDGLALTSRNV
jgi:pantoate--beta-alanine ligase